MTSLEGLSLDLSFLNSDDNYTSKYLQSNSHTRFVTSPINPISKEFKPSSPEETSYCEVVLIVTRIMSYNEKIIGYMSYLSNLKSLSNKEIKTLFLEIDDFLRNSVIYQNKLEVGNYTSNMTSYNGKIFSLIFQTYKNALSDLNSYYYNIQEQLSPRKKI